MVVNECPLSAKVSADSVHRQILASASSVGSSAVVMLLPSSYSSSGSKAGSLVTGQSMEISLIPGQKWSWDSPGEIPHPGLLHF